MVLKCDMLLMCKPADIRRLLLYMVACLFMLQGAVVTANGAGKSADKEPGLIIDNRSLWLAHVTLRPEVFGTASDPKQRSDKLTPAEDYTYNGAKLGLALPPDQPHCPLPESGWMNPDFDDSGWWRSRTPFFSKGNEGRFDRAQYERADPLSVALLCMRGKFLVADPARVDKLTFSLGFRGGAIVYLNGEEVFRKRMPAGKIALETLADDYPDVPAKGGAYVISVTNDLPVGKLKKGINVVAVEIHRSALSEKELVQVSGVTGAELRYSGEGIERDPATTKGLRVWATDLLDEVNGVEPGRSRGAVRIVCARGATCSGQFVVAADPASGGFKVDVGALRTTAGQTALPASAVSVRYGFPVRLRETVMYDRLDVAPPKQITAEGLPVWITVAPPADALPGNYDGTITVRTDGGEAEIPLNVYVSAWQLPDGPDMVTWIDMAQSPDTLAIYYKVQMWSEEHWRLIGRTFDLLRTIGNKTVYIPLICTTHLGNEESMVRWKKTATGYEYDFSVMDRYLDECEKHMGKPALVILYAYDFFLGTSGSAHQGGDSAVIKLISHETDESVPVTDAGVPPGSKPLLVPSYADSEAEKAWVPMGAELMKHIKARGLEKRVALGMCGDLQPPKKYLELLDKVFPGTPWVVHSHSPMRPNAKLYSKYSVVHSAAANMMKYAIDPAIRRDYGWNLEMQATAPVTDGKGRGGYLDPGGKRATAVFPRYMRSPDRVLIRCCAEYQITGWQIGVGRLMADFFGPREPRQSLPVFQRYPRTWSNMGIGLVRTWFSPGATGSETTIGFEVLREGVQECEARICIEKSLLDGRSRAKLGEPLAKKSQEILDRRLRYMLWMFRQGDFSLQAGSKTCLLGNGNCREGGGAMPLSWYSGSGWQERSKELFDAAAEITRILSSK